ncbi:hypothetical protein O3M35_009571 [Rhynocoris fuscipes]|uniref:Uncharacterized protein n=1 Tax=Rhynocoris fuscipes TaxID=488301 RepID=A0AAW1DB01_9HEMI
MKKFDFQISMVLSLPKAVLTNFGMTHVCVCVCVCVILHNSKTIGRRILKFWI